MGVKVGKGEKVNLVVTVVQPQPKLIFIGLYNNTDGKYKASRELDE